MTRAIEVVGVAGSGKSTLLGHLVSARGDSFRLVDSAKSTSAPVRVAAARAVLTTAAAWRRPPATAQIARWWARLGAFDLALRSDDERVAVFDQGPVYTLARLAEIAPPSVADGWWSREVEHWAPKLSAVVSLDADDDVLVERITSRTKAHALRDLPPSEIRVALGRARTAMGRTSQRFADLGVPVVRLDSGMASVEQLTNDLVDRLAELVPPSALIPPRRTS